MVGLGGPRKPAWRSPLQLASLLHDLHDGMIPSDSPLFQILFSVRFYFLFVCLFAGLFLSSTSADASARNLPLVKKKMLPLLLHVGIISFAKISPPSVVCAFRKYTVPSMPLFLACSY